MAVSSGTLRFKNCLTGQSASLAAVGEYRTAAGVATAGQSLQAVLRASSNHSSLVSVGPPNATGQRLATDCHRHEWGKCPRGSVCACLPLKVKADPVPSRTVRRRLSLRY